MIQKFIHLYTMLKISTQLFILGMWGVLSHHGWTVVLVVSLMQLCWRYHSLPLRHWDASQNNKLSGFKQLMHEMSILLSLVQDSFIITWWTASKIFIHTKAGLGGWDISAYCAFKLWSISYPYYCHMACNLVSLNGLNQDQTVLYERKSRWCLQMIWCWQTAEHLQICWHWKSDVIILMKFSTLAASDFVKITTFGSSHWRNFHQNDFSFGG